LPVRSAAKAVTAPRMTNKTTSASFLSMGGASEARFAYRGRL
jgi:hypothetical protein